MTKKKKKGDDFLIRPKDKIELKKVSVKLLLTPEEGITLDNYSILTGVGKNEVVSFSVKRLLRQDRKFRKLIEENSPATQKKLFVGKLKMKGKTPKTETPKKTPKKKVSKKTPPKVSLSKDSIIS